MRVLGERILVERLDGPGVEEVLPSGIILPATREASIQTRRDTFRARVLAMSDEAKRQLPDVAVGHDLLVFTYSGKGETVFTGEVTPYGIAITPDDILCAVDGR